MLHIPVEYLPWLQVDAKNRRDNLRVQLNNLTEVRAPGSPNEAEVRRALEHAIRLCAILGVDDSQRAAA